MFIHETIVDMLFSIKFLIFDRRVSLSLRINQNFMNFQSYNNTVTDEPFACFQN